MTNIYFNIQKKAFETTKAKANKNAIKSDPNDEKTKNELLYEMDLTGIETEFDDGNIHVRGNAVFEGKDMGFFELTFKPDQELIVDIIETYVKQLNKVKTLIEATK
jgi:hypothetical protein